MPARPVARLGLLTDVHYADAEARGTRFYRESLGKVREAVAAFVRAEVDEVVHLGDLVDSPADTTPAHERSFLRTIRRELARVERPCRFVLGNHCVATLTRAEYLSLVGQERAHFTWTRGGVRFVVLDACHRADETPYAPGNFRWSDTEVPRAQRDWLARILSESDLPTVVFCHQRLDLTPPDDHLVKSAPAVRQVLESAGCVRAVFMGHTHANALNEIGGIRYATLRAVVEGSGLAQSGYAVLECFADGSLRLVGFREHAAHPLAQNRA